jgi:hypothetical protein
MKTMTPQSKNPHLGSTLDDFLKEEGIYEEATTAAIDKVIAYQTHRGGRRAFVTLRFAGDELDTREISAIVPIEPTRAHRKGEAFFAGEHAGSLRGRTGMWFLATDKLVDSDDLVDHLRFVEKLLYPEPADASRISKLRNVLERANSRAHVTCFWRDGPGDPAPPIPPRFKSMIEPLAADIETDFAAGNL